MGVILTNKYINCLLKSIIITCIVVFVDMLGVDFLALKMASFPFVSSKNIDNISDYYTALWGKMDRVPVDNEKFAIVDITENDREQIAQILTILNEMNPRVIGMDVSFLANKDRYADSILVSSIQAIQNIVLPVELSKDKQSLLYDIFHDEWKDKQFGVVSVPNIKNVLRTYIPTFYLPRDTIDAFGCVIAQDYGVDISNLRNKKQLLINYTTIHPIALEAIPGEDLLNMNSQDSLSISSQVENRIVLLGAQDPTDSHPTPLGYSMPGVMIHAHIINSIIENKNISSIPSFMRYLLCWILSFLMLWWNVHREYPNPQIKTNKWLKLSISFIVYFISLILFAGLGAVIFCKCCYYIDFAPYIVTSILVFLLNDKISIILCRN